MKKDEGQKEGQAEPDGSDDEVDVKLKCRSKIQCDGLFGSAVFVGMQDGWPGLCNQKPSNAQISRLRT